MANKKKISHPPLGREKERVQICDFTICRLIELIKTQIS